MVKAGVTEAKELKRTRFVDYYQYLDVPILAIDIDITWNFRRNIKQNKIFHWKKFYEYPELQQITNKKPYAPEPIINIGAWILNQ